MSPDTRPHFYVILPSCVCGLPFLRAPLFQTVAFAHDVAMSTIDFIRYLKVPCPYLPSSFI